MKDNVNKVLERGEQLTEIETKAENLRVTADQFERSTGRLKRRFWWKNFRATAVLATVVLVVIAVIVVVAILA